MPFVSAFLFQLADHGVSDYMGIAARSHLFKHPWAEFLEHRME